MDLPEFLTTAHKNSFMQRLLSLYPSVHNTAIAFFILFQGDAMSLTGPSQLRYLRFARFLESSLQSSQQAMPEKHLTFPLLFTLLSVTTGLSYAVESADFSYYTITETPLSKILATVPLARTTVFKGGLLPLSIRYIEFSL